MFAVHFNARNSVWQNLLVALRKQKQVHSIASLHEKEQVNNHKWNSSQPYQNHLTLCNIHVHVDMSEHTNSKRMPSYNKPASQTPLVESQDFLWAWEPMVLHLEWSSAVAKNVELAPNHKKAYKYTNERVQVAQK